MSSVQRWLILVTASFAALAACTTSDRIIRAERDAGAQGTAGDEGTGSAGSGGHEAGSSGTAGGASTSGAAGTGSASGAAGTSGAAAGPGSTAGTSGAAGARVDAGAGAAGAAGRDAGAPETSTGPAVTYSNYIEGLLTLRCGGCHYGTNMQGGFSISYANVMAHVSAGTSGCSKLDASKARIVPGNPDASLIYIKTNLASPPAGCGGHMPYQNTSLLPDQLVTLHDWIMAGAKQ